MLIFYVADPGAIGVLQEEDAKLGVLGADLLGNVDPPLPASEPHQLHQGWLPTCNVVVEGWDVNASGIWFDIYSIANIYT